MTGEALPRSLVGACLRSMAAFAADGVGENDFVADDFLLRVFVYGACLYVLCSLLALTAVLRGAVRGSRWPGRYRGLSSRSVIRERASLSAARADSDHGRVEEGGWRF